MGVVKWAIFPSIILGLLTKFDYLGLQEVPKKFVKECHQSCNNQIDRTKPLFLAIYSPTLQNLADLNYFAFSNQIRPIFAKKDLEFEKNSKEAARFRTWH